jgi:16S rRNA (uracil1498-N3)-methyltransferase
VLEGPEAHHLIHVKRAKPGERVVLFDGSGAEFSAQVEATRRDRVELSVLERVEVNRELPFELTLGVTLPKGDRQRWLVEKAVELGITRVVPLVTSRSVAEATGGALARLRRTVIEASKQCGRNRLAEIAEPQEWGRFVSYGPEGAIRLVAHPASENTSMDAAPPIGPGEISSSRSVLLAIGPEGGFADEELASALAAGWTPIDLGPRILRIETAAIFLVALVLRGLR